MTSPDERTNHRRARTWTGVVSLATCLTVALGAGVADAATRDAGQAVDWASVVEPALNCPEREPNAAWYTVRARVAAVGDLTRDGRRETVVVSSCPSPTSSNPLIAFVYDGASKPSAPHLLENSARAATSNP